MGKNAAVINEYNEGQRFFLNLNYEAKCSNALFTNLAISEFCVAFFATIGLFISISNYEQSLHTNQQNTIYLWSNMSCTCFLLLSTYIRYEVML